MQTAARVESRYCWLPLILTGHVWSHAIITAYLKPPENDHLVIFYHSNTSISPSSWPLVVKLYPWFHRLNQITS